MLITRLHQFLIPPTTKPSRRQVVFWFSLSLTFAVIYSILAWQQAFSHEYVVQDDARQHVFWMMRFVDSGLFPNDLIADYFQSVAPVGYTALYKLMATVGISPLVFNKLLPLGLGLITTAYCFGICLQILPVPAAAFMASLMLNQNLWVSYDLSSATPRAFLYPLLVAFMYYVLRRALVPCLVVLVLQGLFYQPCVLISAGVLVLQLVSWNNGRVQLSRSKRDYWFCGIGLGLSILILLPNVLIDSPFGPTIELDEARRLPEFQPKGRVSFFDDNFWEFWLEERSGMFPGQILIPATLAAALLLPILLRFPTQFPLVRQVNRDVGVLGQLSLVSFGLFFAAHAVLFVLYLPSRYTQHSLRIVLAIAAAIALTILLDAVFHWAQKPTERKPARQVLAWGTAALVGVAVIFYPSFLEEFPDPNYKEGKVAALYEFFSQQPKDSLIASLSPQVDFVPTFSQRSVLVGREYGIPYHTGYYRKFRQRSLDLIQAQYSSDLSVVQAFIQKYGVDFWLLDPGTFTPGYIADNPWIRQFQPPAGDAQAGLEKGTVPALMRVMQPCSVFETNGFQVLEAKCISKGGNG